MKKSIFLAILLGIIVFAVTAQCPSFEPKAQKFVLNDSIIRNEMVMLSQQQAIPLHYNSTVKSFIELYVNRRNIVTSKMLHHSYTYFPAIEAGLVRHQLPNELKYFAMVESAMNPSATSRCGRKGLWQLQPSWVRQNNLIVNDYVNECYDPEVATEVACQRLAELYARYGDWLLTMVAFDTSIETVDKAISTADGNRDYWAIQRYLPSEARGFVPAYMALVYVMSHAAEYDLYPTCPIDIWHETETLSITDSLMFGQIQNDIGISIEELAMFNPKYLQETIPATSENTQTIRIPKNYAKQFKQTYKTIVL